MSLQIDANPGNSRGMRLSGAEKIGLALTLVFGFGGGIAMINDPHQYVRLVGYGLMGLSALGMCALAWHHLTASAEGRTKIRLTRQEKQLAKLGWITDPISKYVDLKTAISKINDETKVGDIAYPNPFGKSEIDEVQAQYIWQMLKNLAEAGVIKIYYLQTSTVYQTKYKSLEPSMVKEFNLIVSGSLWLSHEDKIISMTIKIDPADLEKAISQIRSEIKIATKNRITNPPTLPPLIQAPQPPQSGT